MILNDRSNNIILITASKIFFKSKDPFLHFSDDTSNWSLDTCQNLSCPTSRKEYDSKREYATYPFQLLFVRVLTAVSGELMRNIEL